MKKGERQLTEYNKIFTSDKLNYYLTYLIYEEFYNKKDNRLASRWKAWIELLKEDIPVANQHMKRCSYY